MLRAADVAPYLLRNGLLRPRAVVDGRLRVVDVSRSNRVFLVTAEGEPGYVVKAPVAADDRWVGREAEVLDRLRSRGLTSFLPKPVFHDAVAGVLVLEAPPGARSLGERNPDRRFSLTLARRAGRALAALHAGALGGALAGLPSADPAGSLAVHRLDLETRRALSGASLDLIRRVQASGELCAALDELLAARPADRVVHGDVRWDNWLAIGRPGSARRTRLMLIDWELAAPGDSAMDVGAHLAGHLAAWREAAARAGGPADPSRALPAMQPAVAAFWDAYRGGGAAGPGATLSRAMRFAGARLVLIALEQAQQQPELRPGVLATLQLGANVLRRPDEAAAHLLGLGAGRAGR